MRHSVELVLIGVLDTLEAVPFYESLGFRVISADREEATLDGRGLQIVLERVDHLESDDGRPRAELRVSLEVLERVWKRDDRDEPTLPGPTLSSDGMFEYRTRDPSGNRIRIVAPIPDDAR